MSQGLDRIGWKDLINDLVIRGSGVNAPSYVQIGATGMYAYEFVGTGASFREAFVNFHINHDYLGASDIHFHVHFLTADANAGNVKWYAQVAYAKRDSAAFNLGALVNVNVTIAAAGVQYQHQVAEVVVSAAAGAGGLLDNANFETDGILMVRFYRDPADVADTYGSSVFVLCADCHYQSDHTNTLNKASPFN
jgi:hypothetical protein